MTSKVPSFILFSFFQFFLILLNRYIDLVFYRIMFFSTTWFYWVNPCHRCMRVALKVAYDGTGYSGYARQPGQRTVEQTLLDFLINQRVVDDAKTSYFRTASRTDRGVSALGNTCAFDTMSSKYEIFSKLTTHISDIYIYGVREVIPDFYPRHAIRREYRYYLRKTNLDVDKLLSAARLFTGEHNFQNFARVEPLKNPIRSIENIIISEKQGFVVFDFYAQTFLWNQVRRIVSALKKVGEGTLSEAEIRQALRHPEKKVDFQLAAPKPLILKDVVYDFAFEYVEGFKKKLQDIENKILVSL